MTTKYARYAFAAAIAALAAGCGQSETAAPGAPTAAAPAAATTPDATVAVAVKALRSNNVSAFLDSVLPAGEVAKMKADWNKEMNKDPVTEEDRKQFADTMTKLTAPDAEAKMYAEIEPKLKEFDTQSATQMPMMIMMGQNFAQSSIQQNKEMNDAQKQQATQMIDATAKWAQSTKFTDPALVKGAIGAICKTARDLNLKSVDEARALTYDQAMQKAGIVLGGVKQVLGVYGLNVDKALDSVKVETVSSAGDTAKVKVTYTAFEQPFTTEGDLVKVDGHWYGKQAMEQWKKHEQEAASGAVAQDKPADSKG